MGFFHKFWQSRKLVIWPTSDTMRDATTLRPASPCVILCPTETYPVPPPSERDLIFEWPQIALLLTRLHVVYGARLVISLAYVVICRRL